MSDVARLLSPRDSMPAPDPAPPLPYEAEASTACDNDTQMNLDENPLPDTMIGTAVASAPEPLSASSVIGPATQLLALSTPSGMVAAEPRMHQSRGSLSAPATARRSSAATSMLRTKRSLSNASLGPLPQLSIDAERANSLVLETTSSSTVSSVQATSHTRTPSPSFARQLSALSAFSPLRNSLLLSPSAPPHLYSPRGTLGSPLGGYPFPSSVHSATYKQAPSMQPSLSNGSSSSALSGMAGTPLGPSGGLAAALTPRIYESWYGGDLPFALLSASRTADMPDWLRQGLPSPSWSPALSHGGTSVSSVRDDPSDTPGDRTPVGASHTGGSSSGGGSGRHTRQAKKIGDERAHVGLGLSGIGAHAAGLPGRRSAAHLAAHTDKGLSYLGSTAPAAARTSTALAPPASTLVLGALRDKRPLSPVDADMQRGSSESSAVAAKRAAHEGDSPSKGPASRRRVANVFSEDAVRAGSSNVCAPGSSSAAPSPKKGQGATASDESEDDAAAGATELVFPKPDIHPLGRLRSAPPEAERRATNKYMAAEQQAARFPGDLYTPAWVRTARVSPLGAGSGGGKKGGASAADAPAKSAGAGRKGSKEAWCGLCDAKDPKHPGWLHLKNSSYRYHLLRHHGISPRSLKPFSQPVSLRTGDKNRGTMEAKCHSCKCWVPMSTSSHTKWSIHASTCHMYNADYNPSEDV